MWGTEVTLRQEGKKAALAERVSGSVPQSAIPEGSSGKRRQWDEDHHVERQFVSAAEKFANARRSLALNAIDERSYGAEFGETRGYLLQSVANGVVLGA